MDNKNEQELILEELEQRIDALQDMGDDELGTFTRRDWWILIVIAIILPVIAIILAR